VDIIHDGDNAPVEAPAEVCVTTFGHLHGAPPEGAHITLDLREHFRDPHVAPELRDLTAYDVAVREAVLATPGIGALVDATAHAVLAYLAGPSGGGPIRVAVGCAGGRHRAPAVGMELVADLAELYDVTGEVIHRDLYRPVVDRPAPAAVRTPAGSHRRNRTTTRER
jgi:RNase adaptor protein for sRNA GlmZ degradation